MSTRNSLYVICLAFLYSATVINGQSTKFSRSWTTQFDNREIGYLVVETGDMIVGVGNHFIDIMTFDGVEINTCEYSLPPNATVSDRYRAVALGNGKIVVHIFIAVTDENIENPRFWDFFVIVDPQNCSRTKTLSLQDIHHDYIIVSIVPYHDSFDLFIGPNSWSDVYQRDVTSKAPRRFNDMAELIPLDYHFALEMETRDLQIETVRPYDASSGYICRQFVSPYSTRLMRLDSKFQMIKETKIGYKIWETSITRNRISLCRSSGVIDPSLYSSPFTCNFFDSKDLSLKTSVQMYVPPVYRRASFTKLVNLPDGSTVVAFGYLSDKDLQRGWGRIKGLATEIYLQRIDADGIMGKPIFVDKYYNMRWKIFDDFSAKIVSLDGGEVCLFLVDNSFDNNKRLLNTKCIRLDKLMPMRVNPEIVIV